MKKMKKIMCLLLAIVLVLGMSMTVFAAEDVGTTVDNHVSAQEGGTPDISKHDYVAYKIFQGTQAVNEDELASIKWADETEDGTSVLGSKILAEVAKNNSINGDFTDVKTAQDVAEIVSNYGDDSDKARAFARCVYEAVKNDQGASITIGQEMETGYYLIVDRTVFNGNDTNTAYNLALLQLTNKGIFVIQNKTDVPQVEKKVLERNDSTGTTTEWQDAADYDISDAVPFKLTGTLPSNYADYASYKYVFHDTLSKGLAFNADVKVTIDGNDDQDITSHFKVTPEEESDGAAEIALTISCDNLKEIAGLGVGNKIVVTYTATLTDDANIGSAGNPNVVYLEYSNNPNGGGTGEERNDTGKTPEDRVIVFTYEIEANKVDEGLQPLGGAGFTLFKLVNGVETQIGAEITGETTFSFTGVDAGEYILRETTVPDGYNKADDLEFEVRSEYTEKSDNPSLTALEVYGKDEDGKYTVLLSADSADAAFRAELTTGVLSTTVVNLSGLTLPETGGIGTTIFYVLGGSLVVICGVILVTKKRVGK